MKSRPSGFGGPRGARGAITEMLPRARVAVPVLAFLGGGLLAMDLVSAPGTCVFAARSVIWGSPGCDTGAVVLATIRQRRTVRAFGSAPVPERDLLAILDAARFAPTAGNQQPWKFLVIRDRERLDRLRDTALHWYMERASRSPAIGPTRLAAIRVGVEKALIGALSAPVYVAVLVDTTAPYPQYVVEDGTLAAGMLMVAARALGYGTGFFTTFFPSDRMRQFFAIPDRYQLICFSPIGVPDRWPEIPHKKGLDDVVVYESFRREGTP
jgi:nitroreductase